MNEIQKLLAEIEDSNNKILADSRLDPSEEVLGNINNNACDIAYFLEKLEKLLLTGGGNEKMRYACYTDSSRTKFLGYVTGKTYWEADEAAATRFGGKPYLMLCV